MLDELLARCTFPASGTPAAVAFSGGPDSTALVALAVHHGLEVTAHHVDHGLRNTSRREADQAAAIADRLGVQFERHEVHMEHGPNLEARARDARLRAVPDHAMTGHTADDQAETLMIRLLRGSGSRGLAGMEPGIRHPLLRLRRHETEAVCAHLGIDPVRDPTNDAGDMWRNRVRSELLPLASAIAKRDVGPILARTADLLRDDARLLDELSQSIDPTDARALARADPALARRAIRQWLTIEGYPPEAAAVARVLAVAHGDAVACELPGGRRVERSGQRFRIVESPE